MSKPLRVLLVLVVIVSLMSATGLAVANGTVDPPTVDEVMYPGTSVEIDKEVTTPPIPPIVDICLLEDETGSFYDDIGNLQLAASDLYDTIVATSPDAQFAVAGFRDYPQAPYGITGDHVYHLLSTMSPIKSDWIDGVNALTAYGGNDEPEAQYDAIVAAAGPGVFNDPTLGEQDPCGWRDEPGVQRVLIVATDAPFHTPAAGAPHVNDEASTILALTDEDIILIGLKGVNPSGVGPGTELDALAAATGGSVQPVTSDGANIATAILDALEELTADVWWTEDCGPDLDVSLTPDVYYDVLGNTTLSFVETIAVPNATPPGNYYCTVTFWAGEYEVEGAEIGTQDIHVEVIPIPIPLDIKPTSCPNPLNTKDKGVLPVAILGAEDFDVTTVDPATVQLEGVAPLRWAMEDVATPFEPWLGKSDCREDCTEEGPDGYMDLTIKFDTQQVVAALGSVLDRECMVLTITGNFLDGRAFEGEDVVLILYKVK